MRFIVVNINRIQEFIQSRNGLYTAYFIILIMALLIITQLYQGVGFFHQVKPQVIPELQEKPVEKLPNLSEWHLLGINQQTVVTKDLPQTTLNLKLDGVFAATPESESFAIISVPGSEGKLYGINAELPGDAKLHSILTNSVIISRNGHLEKLSLPETKLILGTEPHSLNLPLNSK